MFGLLFETFKNSAATAPEAHMTIWIIIEAILFTLIFTYYLGRRLISASPLGRKTKLFAWIFLIISIYSFPLIFFVGVRSSFITELPVWIYIITSGLWAFVAYLFFLTILSDLGIVLFKTVNLISKPFRALKKSDGGKSERCTNARHWMNRYRSYIIISASFLLFIVGFLQSINQPDFVERDVHFSDKAPDKEIIRLVHMSDLHLNPLTGKEWLDNIIKKVKSSEPDLIVITGDFADCRASQGRKYLELFKDFKIPIFFISGNHEVLWGLDEWLKEIDRAGITVLDGRRMLVEVRGVRVLIAGIGDSGGGAWNFKVSPHFFDLLREAPKSDLKILLAHRPEILPYASKAGFDLVLAGHTHGGQTFPLNLFAGLFTPYVKGFYREGRTILFTSPGAGYVGPPIRAFVPKEVTLFTIHIEGNDSDE